MLNAYADAEADVWKVSITTGIYEPPAIDEITDNDDINTNNNANDKDVSQKKRSIKYHVAPWAPVGQIFIVIYGDSGQTGSLPLMSDQPREEEKFLPGHADTFKVVSLCFCISHTRTNST